MCIFEFDWSNLPQNFDFLLFKVILISQQHTCKSLTWSSSRSEHAGDAGSVCSGQQPGRSDAAEAGRADGPQSKSYTGERRAGARVVPAS